MRSLTVEAFLDKCIEWIDTRKHIDLISLVQLAKEKKREMLSVLDEPLAKLSRLNPRLLPHFVVPKMLSRLASRATRTVLETKIAFASTWKGWPSLMNVFFFCV